MQESLPSHDVTARRPLHLRRRVDHGANSPPATQANVGKFLPILQEQVRTAKCALQVSILPRLWGADRGRTRATRHLHLLLQTSLFFLDALEDVISNDLAEPARLLQPHPLDIIAQDLEADFGQQGWLDSLHRRAVNVLPAQLSVADDIARQKKAGRLVVVVVLDGQAAHEHNGQRIGLLAFPTPVLLGRHAALREELAHRLHLRVLELCARGATAFAVTHQRVRGAQPTRQVGGPASCDAMRCDARRGQECREPPTKERWSCCIWARMKRTRSRNVCWPSGRFDSSAAMMAGLPASAIGDWPA